MDERLRFVARLLEGEKMAPLRTFRWESNETTSDHGRCETVCARPIVMPLETVAHVARDSDVVARWLADTSNDVDDSFFSTVHASPIRMARARTNLEQFFRSGSILRGFYDLQ